MKRKRVYYAVSLFLVFVLLLGGCAKKSESTAMDKADYGYAENSMDTASTLPAAEESTRTADSAGVAVASTDSKASTQFSLTNSSSITVGSSKALQKQDKIIRTFQMNVETQEFDTLINTLDAEINRLQGYVESSQISGRSFYDSEGTRLASITARIPRDKVDEFVNMVGDKANVVNKQEATENVSLAYADIESRKKALEIEQERLFAILDKADKLENIITLESRLSDIRYELQNYETTLLTYDNQVEYSTVNLSVQEVEKLTPAVEVKQTVGTRMKNGLSNTMYRLGEGGKDFLVWFVVNLPYLIIWTLIIAAIALISRKIYKKRVKDSGSSQPPTPPVS